MWQTVWILCTHQYPVSLSTNLWIWFSELDLCSVLSPVCFTVLLHRFCFVSGMLHCATTQILFCLRYASLCYYTDFVLSPVCFTVLLHRFCFVSGMLHCATTQILFCLRYASLCYYTDFVFHRHISLDFFMTLSVVNCCVIVGWLFQMSHQPFCAQ